MNKSKYNKKLYKTRNIENIKDMLNQSAQLFADEIAFKLKDSDGVRYDVTYAQYKREVDALGSAFMDLGLSGTRIAVISENRYEWCVGYMAAVNGTCIVVPIDSELPYDDIENIVQRSNASAIVFSKKHTKNMEKLLKADTNIKYFICMDACPENDDNFTPYKSLIQAGEALLDSGYSEFINAEIDNTAMSILLFTSGTTGFAKGVMLSHKNIVSNIMSVCETVYVDTKDSSLSILPIHHTYECTVGFLCLIYCGAAIAFSEGLRRIPSNLKEYQPTLMITVPLLLENVYRKIWDQAGKKKIGKPLLTAMTNISGFFKAAFNINIGKKLFGSIHDSLGGNLRLVMVGAAAIEPKVSKFFRYTGISVLQGYGLTETSPLLAGNRDAFFKDSAAGIPIPGVDVEILDPDEKGVGEIIARGDNVMLGYYEDEESTNDSIIDGWFHTGDLGCFDKDGFLHIAGRAKNVIVTKTGKNIFPEELEASINRIPFVLESMVYGGVDDRSGEVEVHAQIVPNLDAIKERFKNINVSTEEIKELFNNAIKEINRKLPIYKHIKQFNIRETEFVKTTTRKIKRHLEKKPTEKDN